MQILYIIAAVLVAIWLAGLVLHLLGWLIHIVLIVALALVIYSFIRGRMRV
jgi:hypothetical protein